MTDYPYDAPVTLTTNPVEGEVSQALALYKIALINASYRNFWHRLSCKMGDKEALEHEQRLVEQELQCRNAVNQSAEHREMLESLIRRQSEDSRQQDQFIRLLKRS
ncbi:hypothetical protein SM438_21005 [Salmonella enterica]|nr:hypothetical protein [Salmonella enterica]MEA1704875.1 hypothetical protein [Salmonella enterica subsp. enterica serovar Minnesota]MDX9555283.1 hypothetical protein [Salmonella enterica]MDX9564507.1 hypothetical protein [Salmonella enterica]MDX9569096.1 hypothetical protein [Salmonella enterica]